MGYSLRGHKELGTTEQLSTHTIVKATNSFYSKSWRWEEERGKIVKI